MILWFKQRYVESILSGEKTDTIRRRSSRLPVAGQIVSFSVGPRPAFARARVIAVEDVDLSNLSPGRAGQVTELFDPRESFSRIRFELLCSDSARRESA